MIFLIAILNLPTISSSPIKITSHVNCVMILNFIFTDMYDYFGDKPVKRKQYVNHILRIQSEAEGAL